MMTTEPQPTLSHLDDEGRVRMVDVGHKPNTQRSATAEARIRIGPRAWGLLLAQANAKGEVLNTARIAGILAAKRCDSLIPLCHGLPLSFVGVDFISDEASHTLVIRSTCRSEHTTGVEMEALTACTVAALTVYDMCKAADKGMVIEQVRLLHKSGGKSGEWRAD
ncbi:cyclic pyranopterin monophosphate synthase MoaC [Castellaniella sp.]|uniref:cyclic pyranopterin monophosphate synthase MoaC n=1 Tax=Castellaniella sp. TaxID=1955812 RepID=UPI00355FC619